MSAIQFLVSGGMASIGGDLPEDEQKIANNIVKSFAEKVKQYARQLQVPASLLKIQQCTFLFVAKDLASFHFIFADAPGGASINYKNLALYGRLELQALVHQIRIDVGDVVWAFSCPLNIPVAELEEQIKNVVQQYVNTVLVSQRKPDKKISDEVISSPEIASGLEEFRIDYPVGVKTAFIIMPFDNTKAHCGIVQCVKKTLETKNIIGLRADDKEYLDDLFLNVKTYMHGCDFGIAVFERITRDNFNPNVSLEVGYMFGMGKSVLLLKDKTLQSLQADLAGKLYKPFDTQDVEGSVPAQIEKWLVDKGIVK